MKLDSKYFDPIRVKPDEDRLLRERAPSCQWQGCDKPGIHPAPRGRGREGEYFNFCLTHVREYNKTYNYFSGMSDDEVANFQLGSVTGHRPTWSMGINSAIRSGHINNKAQPNGFSWRFSVKDAFDFLNPSDGFFDAQEAPRRLVRNAERKCLRALDLDDMASATDIKARFKLLVKRHHPDSHEGKDGSQEKLREVIQAYNYLKKAGLC